ncbi:TRAM domain protein, partial [Vibrio parahaemolyticus V-223/04]
QATRALSHFVRIIMNVAGAICSISIMTNN